MKIIALFLVYFTFAFSANGKDNVLTISLVDPVEEIYLSNVQIHSKDDHIYIGITDENGNIKIKKDKLPAFIELSKDGYVKLIYDVSKVKSYVEISLEKMAVQTLPDIETEKKIPLDSISFNEALDEKAYFQEASNKALISYINKNLIYPQYAIEHNISGKVYLRFVIEVDGSVSNTKVIRGASPCLDREALRIISTMPKWVPGILKGKKVRSFYLIPLTFKLT